jgi:predicted DNA-binding transcriptional regulator AlpA
MNSICDGAGLLDKKTVARILGISIRTLDREIARKRFAEPLKVGSCSKFTEVDILAYLNRLSIEARGHS